MADYNSSYTGAQIDEAIGTVRNGARLLPAGGTSGQVLLKDSDADYDATWGDIDRTPVSIAVTTLPTKTTYEQLESFDPTGMAVTCTFTDGGTRVLQNSILTFSPSVFASTGTVTVTISAAVDGFTMTTTTTVTVTAITIDSWAKAFLVGRSGVANQIMQVGDAINGTYTVGNSVYTCPWIVMDFRDVEDENGNIYYNAPIVQMQYTGHVNVVFDAKELVEATEATAQSGFYYFGYTTSYTALNLSVGDTIPYGSYTKVYKSIYNSSLPIRYGCNEWRYSWYRQYLNNGAAGYATPQHPCDVLPANALTTPGFMSYIDADLAQNVHPIKVATQQTSYAGGQTVYTYDKFFPLSISEMNMSNSSMSPNDGEPLEYYKLLLDSDEKKNIGTYSQLIRYAIDSHSTAKTVNLRSANIVDASIGVVTLNGVVSIYGSPDEGNRVLPACALV